MDSYGLAAIIAATAALIESTAHLVKALRPGKKRKKRK